MYRAEICKTACQYAADVSMPDYDCTDECQYLSRLCERCGGEGHHLSVMPTRLASIARNCLSVECLCGHSAQVPVASLLPAYAELTVDEAIRRMRCTSCGARSVQEWRITYVGGSAEAMQGARQD